MDKILNISVYINESIALAKITIYKIEHFTAYPISTKLLININRGQNLNILAWIKRQSATRNPIRFHYKVMNSISPYLFVYDKPHISKYLVTKKAGGQSYRKNDSTTFVGVYDYYQGKDRPRLIVLSDCARPCSVKIRNFRVQRYYIFSTYANKQPILLQIFDLPRFITNFIQLHPRAISRA